VTPITAGASRKARTMVSQVSPTMASSSTTARPLVGSRATTSVTMRPPIECPANTARLIPRCSTARASSSAYALRSAPPAASRPVPPWPAVSMATTLKPLATRRDSVWA
jgi:hypothetical protein